MDLEVYKQSRELSKLIFIVSQSFPSHEKYSLTDQIRRSSRSIGAQIAEAWGKRKYEKHFIAKLTDADSEQYETKHWIETAWECGYLNENEKKTLCNYCDSICKMIQSMIIKAPSFCKL
jgi:four helix bundle protein